MITSNFVKLILSICLLLSIIYILRKQLTIKNRIFYIVLSVLCFVALSAYPLENLFYTFESVKDAYEYIYSENSTQVVEGKNSALAIPTGKDKDNNLEFFIKTDGGWKLKNSKTSKVVVHGIFDEVCVTIIECEGDYYVVVNTQDPRQHHRRSEPESVLVLRE